MEKEERTEFKKGDIVINGFAGEGNPIRKFLYLGKGSIRQGRYTHKTYKGIGWDGKKIDLFRDAPLIYAGHMKEYDDFVKALSRLREG